MGKPAWLAQVIRLSFAFVVVGKFNVRQACPRLYFLNDADAKELMDKGLRHLCDNAKTIFQFESIRVQDDKATHLVSKDSSLALRQPVELKGSLAEFVRNIEAQEELSMRQDHELAVAQDQDGVCNDARLTADDVRSTRDIEAAIKAGSLAQALEA